MSLLHVRDLQMRFGGLVALDGISLQVEAGQIFGVIGPNGSGKTTLFNVITGVYRASGGSIEFGGAQIAGAPPDRIARLGIARTFQHSRLVGGLTALDNVLLGFYGHQSPSLLTALFARRRLRGEVQAFTDKAAELVRVFSPALVERFFDRAGDLPYIDRRRLEVCRALAAQPRLLLLDEPTAGMSPEETHEFIEDVHKVRASRPGMTIVIIEHDMSVIGKVSERVACLNYGRKIAEGSFSEVTADPEVRAAYLGGDEVA